MRFRVGLLLRDRAHNVPQKLTFEEQWQPYTVGTQKQRHPAAPCEQGFLPENIACLSV
jgi:hypothetical protein